MQSVAVKQSSLGLKKGQTYTLDTDNNKAVFKTPKGRKVIKMDLELLSKIKFKEAENDSIYSM